MHGHAQTCMAMHRKTCLHAHTWPCTKMSCLACMHVSGLAQTCMGLAQRPCYRVQARTCIDCIAYTHMHSLWPCTDSHGPCTDMPYYRARARACVDCLAYMRMHSSDRMAPWAMHRLSCCKAPARACLEDLASMHNSDRLAQCMPWSCIDRIPQAPSGFTG